MASGTSGITCKMVDYADVRESSELIMLLNAYSMDPMANQAPLSDAVKSTLIAGLTQTPGAFSIIAYLPADVTPKVTPNMTPDVTSDVTPEVTPASDSDSTPVAPALDNAGVSDVSSLENVDPKFMLHREKSPATGDTYTPVGLANCFMGFSTFAARPLVNIHDLVVLPGYRGKGIGQALLQAVEQIAKERGCCKLVLEVRTDNPAERLYRREGFTDGDHPYIFLSKALSS